MMKKALIFILATMFLILCACGQSEVVPEPTQASVETAAPVYEKLYFESAGVKFGIMDEAESVLSALGEPQGSFEADSCAYQGKDYFYYYDGFELTANDVDGALRITGINIIDDTVQTPQGIYIGIDRDDALVLAGCEYEQSGDVYRVYENETVLLLHCGSDGCIDAIEYLSKTADI